MIIMVKYEVWTDGSKGEHGDAGIGVVVVNRDYDGIDFLLGEYIGRETSNYAEFYAVVRSLEEIYERLNVPEYVNITIKSDSQLLVKGMNGEHKIKAPKLVQLKARIEKMHMKLRTEPEYIWVRAHVGNPMNELADFLAVKSMAG